MSMTEGGPHSPYPMGTMATERLDSYGDVNSDVGILGRTPRPCVLETPWDWDPDTVSQRLCVGLEPMKQRGSSEYKRPGKLRKSWPLLFPEQGHLKHDPLAVGLPGRQVLDQP